MDWCQEILDISIKSALFMDSVPVLGIPNLVNCIGDKQVEVVGMAMNLTPVESACCQPPRDLGRINKPVHDAQMIFIENIKYGKQPIKEVYSCRGIFHTLFSKPRKL